jgi:hypothetical protein
MLFRAIWATRRHDEISRLANGQTSEEASLDKSACNPAFSVPFLMALAVPVHLSPLTTAPGAVRWGIEIARTIEPLALLLP